MCPCETKCQEGGESHHFGGVLTSLKNFKSIARCVAREKFTYHKGSKAGASDGRSCRRLLFGMLSRDPVAFWPPA